MVEVTGRERAVTALELGIPDAVPHFELEMQLAQEYFGKGFVGKGRFDSEPGRRSEFLREDARLLLETAERFDYAAIFYSGPYRPDWDSYVEGIRVLREMDEGNHLLMAHGDCTMSIPDGEHMSSLVYRLVDEREAVLEQQRRAVDHSLERGEKLISAGLDGFILCSDYCFNSGPFLSPSMFADFVTPFLKRLTEGYRQMGAYVIKHTDGNIMPILDQLVDTNPHAFHSLDPMAGVDMAEVKRLVGDQVCLMGNVNCALMQTGTDEEVLESCRYAMENGKPGGGYIFSTSNVIFKGMPRERYDMMFEYYLESREY